MSEDLSFAELMERLRTGDSSAASVIFCRFAHRLIGLARQRLEGRMQRKVDPEDIMQSALKSFFWRHADGQFDLATWDSLWSMLVVITLRKCGHRAEHFRAGCRDVRREQSPVLTDDSSDSWAAVAKDPTASQAALLTEAIEQLMSSLGDERERHMLELALQGYSTAEISTMVDRTERTVQRVLSRVRKRLERMRDESD